MRSAFVVLISELGDEESRERFAEALKASELELAYSQVGKGLNTTYLAISCGAEMRPDQFEMKFAQAYVNAKLPHVPGHIDEQFRVVKTFPYPRSAYNECGKQIYNHRFGYRDKLQSTRC